MPIKNSKRRKQRRRQIALIGFEIIPAKEKIKKFDRENTTHTKFYDEYKTNKNRELENLKRNISRG